MLSDLAFSQKDSVHVAHNVIYAEIAGMAGYGSVNYERVFNLKLNFMISARAGLSTYNIKDYTEKFNPDILIPIAVYGSYGKNHKIEIGVGQLFESTIQANITEFKPERTYDFNTVFSVGYRYQKRSGGLFLRAAYTPIIDHTGFFRHWGGISLGYSFY